MEQRLTELKEQVLKRLISEGIIIACGSAMAYVLIFRYLTGFYGIYGVPAWLIPFNLTTIVPAALALILVAILALLYAGQLSYEQVHKKDPSRFSFLVFYGLPAVIYGAIHEGLPNVASSIIQIYATPVIVMLFLYIAWDSRKSDDWWKACSDKEADSQRDLRRFLPPKSTRRRMRKVATAIMFIVAMGYFIPYDMGQYVAQRQTDYIVIDTSPQMIVLCADADRLVCAPFNRKTKEIHKRFTIIKVTDNFSLTMHNEKIGPLKPIR